MNLQYILDSKGRTTGVFIPINEWNDLKSKYKDIEQKNITIPKWHKDIAKERLEDYKNNPDYAINFDSALDDIEKEL
ncbi:MAG TPA: addiction module protein [Marinilabiliaceae bacterium]|nr:addiction module protein [Marinilabiliaceae bacterium]